MIRFALTLLDFFYIDLFIFFEISMDKIRARITVSLNGKCMEVSKIKCILIIYNQSILEIEIYSSTIFRNSELIDIAIKY